MQRKALKLIYRILSAVLTAFLAVIVAANIYTAAARAITGEPQPDLFRLFLCGNSLRLDVRHDRCR